jgi:hypothetical protein
VREPVHFLVARREDESKEDVKSELVFKRLRVNYKTRRTTGQQ